MNRIAMGRRRSLLAACMAAAFLTPVSVLRADDRATAPPDKQANGVHHGPTKPGEGEHQAPNPQTLVDQIQQFAIQTNLTDEQKGKVEAIHTDATGKIKAITAKGPSREVYQIIRADCEQTGAVLNDDQRKSFEEKVQAAMPGSGGGGGGAGGGGAGGGPIARLQEGLAKLNLTDDQKAKVKELVEATRAKAQELRKDDGNQGPPSPEMREKMRPVIEEFHAKLKEILTPEQMNQLKEQSGGPGGAGGPGGHGPGEHHRPGGGNAGGNDGGKSDPAPPPPPQN